MNARDRATGELMSLSEFGIIEQYFTRAGGRADVRVGVGDDAAIVRVPPGHELVIATDTIVDGVHFPEGLDAADIGYRALAVNLSDLAAMGAEPAWASLALTMPAVDEDWLAGFAAGFFELADRHGVQLIGGDTTRGPLSVTVTIQGFVEQGRAVLRSGARAGDLIVVSGTLGDAAAGLAELSEESGRQTLNPATAAALKSRFLRPTPRLALGRFLGNFAHSAIDVSDGFAADLGHILTSSGVGAIVQIADLPVSAELRQAVGDRSAVDIAVNGGDDYELCVTIPVEAWEQGRSWAEQNGLRLTCVGRIEPTPGLRLIAGDGSQVIHHSSGYRHF